MRSLAFALVLAAIPPARPVTATAPPGHDVTVRLEAFGRVAAGVLVTSPDAAMRIESDSGSPPSRALTVRTPVRIRVSANASQVEVTTEGNAAVGVLFEDGASTREQALRVWGRRILLRRSDAGDLLPRSQAVQLMPEP